MYYECRHILPSGAKCASPALRGQSFCYFHHTQRRPAASGPRDPHQDPRRISRRDRHPNPGPHLRLPLIEDAHSIQQSLNAVLQALAASRLQPRTASLLLYGLQVASSNLRALGRNDIYASVRSAHTLPDGTLIADNRLVTDFGDTRDTFRQFSESHPAPQEPGEEPLDNDDEEYDEDSGDEEYEDDEEEDGEDSGDEEYEDDEEENDEEDGDPDEEEDREDSGDEEYEDDGDTDDDNENKNGTDDEDEDEDSEEPEDGQREPAHPTPEPPQTDEIDYRQYIRQKLVEAFLPEAAAAIFEPGTATETSPNHDQTHAT